MEIVDRYNVRIYTPGKGWWGFMSSMDYQKALDEYKCQSSQSSQDEITQLVDMDNNLVLEESIGKLVPMDEVKGNLKSLFQDALDQGYTTKDKFELGRRYNLPHTPIANLLKEMETYETKYKKG